jgi:carbon monoxide dehydrogenase subunit G
MAAPEVTVATEAGVYEVRGEFTTRAPLATAWEVLTDYARIPAFVSSIRESVVEQRNGDSLRVRQLASVGVFPFRRTARVTLTVHEIPRRRIEFSDVSGNHFREYAGSWTLREVSGSTLVSYALAAVPRSGPPEWLGRGFMSHSVNDLLSQVQAEIERRAARP